MEKRRGFGKHLIIDGYECNPEKLSDINHIYNFLEGITDEIEMTKLMPPYVQEISKNPKAYQGFIIIAESHVNIITCPKDRTVIVDVFSCKDFDDEKAINYTKDCFEIRRMEYKSFYRGVDFPKQP
ncbi:MAG TPA: S-adenosylmethionine decarboxylase proenzyme [Candidatus Aenigmarchaeota archaeon]|nr:S-adenosylmethionine decarboxylase proenzyme [Candidatus Aenigmarchaeota archaeon]